MEDLAERVRSLVEPVAARNGAEVVEVQVRRGRTNLVRIVVDRPSGVDLDTCARVSQELGRMLDVEEPVPGSYTLEVTSPGLDRPLKTAEDYRRNHGRKVRVILARDQHEGTVEEVGETSVTLATARGTVEVPLVDIVKATIVLPW